jgi:hypothetical protein
MKTGETSDRRGKKGGEKECHNRYTRDPWYRKFREIVTVTEKSRRSVKSRNKLGPVVLVER